jgi:RNA ligase (TIGR02306 family)
VSSLIVEVCRVDAVELHPNADRMCVCVVKGWKTCATRDPDTNQTQFVAGDKCVFIPPDAVLPPALSDRLGVTKYLTPLGIDTVTGVRPPGGRVRVARLRGFPSYGLIMKPDDPRWEIGTDVAPLLGITKWEPPIESTDGESEKPDPAFHTYFSLENWRNFPELFQDGEEIVLTEKIHGKNCRVGYIRTLAEDGSERHVFMAGSHDVRRKEFVTFTKNRVNVTTGADEEYTVTKRSQFWEVLTEPVRALLIDLAHHGHNVVVFGELYSAGVQDMTYGMANGQYAFRAFDVTVDGRYLDFDTKMAAFARHGVETVPILYRGPYSAAVIEQHISGPTTLCEPDRAGKFKGREGVVIVAVKERTVSLGERFFDRAALKAVSFEYLEPKGGTEFH